MPNPQDCHWSQSRADSTFSSAASSDLYHRVRRAASSPDYDACLLRRLRGGPLRPLFRQYLLSPRVAVERQDRAPSQPGAATWQIAGQGLLICPMFPGDGPAKAPQCGGWWCEAGARAWAWDHGSLAAKCGADW